MQEDFNKEPWGEDASDRMYWLLDMGGGRGLRLCREEAPVEVEPPAAPAKGKGKPKRSHPDQDLEAGKWETLAFDLEGIEEVCASMLAPCVLPLIRCKRAAAHAFLSSASRAPICRLACHLMVSLGLRSYAFAAPFDTPRRCRWGES